MSMLKSNVLLFTLVSVFSLGYVQKINAETLTPIDVATIASDYENNAYAADMKYKDTIIKIRGVVKGVQKGLFGGPFVTLKANNRFMSPQLTFTDYSLDKLAELNKGETITVTCVSTGTTIGVPTFRDCIFPIN